MAEKPIIFSTEMVRAILDGRKTQTRRVLKPQPRIDDWKMWHWKDCQWMDDGLGLPISGIQEYAQYKINDMLWVRETFFVDKCVYSCVGHLDENECVFNRVGDKCYIYKAQYEDEEAIKFNWCHSIHMPREAARIFLRVTDVRVERLQDIKAIDAIREGFSGDRCTHKPVHMAENEPPCNICKSPKEKFIESWDNLHAERGYGWDTNPWVFVYCFERVET